MALTLLSVSWSQFCNQSSTGLIFQWQELPGAILSLGETLLRQRIANTLETFPALLDCLLSIHEVLGHAANDGAVVLCSETL